jgi:hypothetical protein
MPSMCSNLPVLRLQASTEGCISFEVQQTACFVLFMVHQSCGMGADRQVQQHSAVTPRLVFHPVCLTISAYKAAG